MKVTESTGLLCELSDAEAEMLREIAERDGVTPEDALAKAIQNFLTLGVQTPRRKRNDDDTSDCDLDRARRHRADDALVIRGHASRTEPRLGGMVMPSGGPDRQPGSSVRAWRLR